ncbi:hypothetical protein TNCV_4384881 [Trichonephila clavipes]|nr:hypothetical protein TNCV_4384881 [Trichonephila clavipes]
MDSKFFVRLGMSSTDTFEMVNHVYGGDTSMQKQTFAWHRRFRESAEDDGRSGRSQTYRTAESIEKVSAAIRKKRHQTIDPIAESV